MYPNVDLNGFTLVSVEPPPQHQPVILGYRADHIPEVWFGIGFRDPSGVKDVPDTYYLGPRGRDPHYDALAAGDVIMWRAFDKPFCFEGDNPERGRSTYLQWRYILGDEREDADFAADEENAEFWDAIPDTSAELPWRTFNSEIAYRGFFNQSIWPSAVDRVGLIVATGHPIGFGITGASMSSHYGRPILVLDPKAIPDSLWKDGATFPERTVRGFHASRFAIGEFNGWPDMEDSRDYAPLLVCHSGTTLDSPQHWTPAWERGRGGHGIRRWVSFRDLWLSLPEAVRNEHRYAWQSMKRGYERTPAEREEACIA